MHKTRTRSQFLFPLCAATALVCLSVSPARAVPSYGQLKPPGGHGSFTVKRVSSPPGFRTFEFTFLKTSAVRVQSLLVYGPLAPVATRPAGWRYHHQHQYNRWDVDGGAMQPGNAYGGLFLTYRAEQAPDPARFRFGVQVVGKGHGRGAFHQAPGQVLPSRATFSGRVVAPNRVSPVSGAGVQLIRAGKVIQTRTTGADGGFVFDPARLEDGDYMVRVIPGSPYYSISKFCRYAADGEDVFVLIILAAGLPD